MRGAALLAASLLAAAVAPVALGVDPNPQVAVSAGDSVDVRGRHFQAGERVLVRFAAGAALRADPPSWHYRRATADGHGGFAVSFAEITLTRCTSFSARVAGSRGSSAFVERTVRCK